MKNFNIKTAADTLEIDIFGEIGEGWFDEGNTMQSVKRKIEGSKAKSITVNVSSLGGDAFEGLAIHDILAMHPATITTKVIGATASAGTIISMAGDIREMSENALFLVHNAWTISMGNKYDLAKTIDDLNQVDNRLKAIYKNKTKQTDKQIEELLKEERWIDAKEAKEIGFVTNIFKPAKMAASYSEEFKQKILNKFKKKMDYKAIKEVIGDFEATEEGAHFNGEILGALEKKLTEVMDTRQVDIDEAVASKLEEIEAAKALEIQAKVDELAAKEAEFIALKEEKEQEITALKELQPIEAQKLIDLQAKYDALESDIAKAEAKGTKLNGEPHLFPVEKTEKQKLHEANAKHVAKQLKKF